jgi:hypothetical protein
MPDLAQSAVYSGVVSLLGGNPLQGNFSAITPGGHDFVSSGNSTWAGTALTNTSFSNISLVDTNTYNNQTILNSMNITSSNTVALAYFSGTSASNFSGVAFVLGYGEVNGALNELYTLASDEDWKLNGQVYNKSVQVAAILMETQIPPPKVLSHGSNSVVFNWSAADTNLYLTISADKMSAMISTVAAITFKAEIVGPSANHSMDFFSALKQIPHLASMP